MNTLQHQDWIGSGRNWYGITHGLAETVLGLIEWPLESTTFPKQETKVNELTCVRYFGCRARFIIDAPACEAPIALSCQLC